MVLQTFSSAAQQRIIKVDNSLESPVYYSCRDSIYANLQTKIVTLYGAAEVNYESINLTADYIEMDLENKTVLATYTLDEEGNRVGIPKFTDGAEELTAASLKYNFDTKKAYIKELRTKQEENYLYMGIAKRQTNGEIHFKQGKFTTCDLEDPHFHFQLSKAVLVPEKRIVTGPVNLWIRGVPTPLGLPFSFIPTADQKKTGIIFPQIVPFSNYGFGLQDLGYYFPIKKSEMIQTTLYGSIYSRGTFGFKNATEYRKRYKYGGAFNINYDRFRSPFPDTNILQKVTVNWRHQQEANANPYWRFNSNVNFISDNDSKTSIDPVNENFLKNSFNSDINLVRSFPTLPITMGLKTSIKQNSSSNNIDLELPTFSFNANRFYPLKALRRNKIGAQKFYEKIGMTYRLEAKNKALFKDTLLRDRQFDLIKTQFKSGIFQNVNLTTAIPIFKNLATLTPSLRYDARVNFQTIEKYYDANTGTIRDSLFANQPGFSQNASANLQLTSQLYGYYQFIGKNKTKLRHVMTPSATFSYVPDIDSYVFDNLGPTNQLVEYSPSAQSLYREPNSRAKALLSYNLNNSFEIKQLARKDSLNDFKKTRVIDALTFSGNYDFAADSLNFSDITASLRSSPIPSLSFVARGSFSLYGWDEETGVQVNQFANSTNNQLGRFVNTQLTTNYIIASKESKKKIQANQETFNDYWEADYDYYRLNPHEIIDFDIPWKISLSHNWYTRLNTDTSAFSSRNNTQTQTLALNADANFTKRWKIGIATNYDITNNSLNQTVVTLNRDMHCWQLGFRWVPIGANQSFVLRLNATSALFKDAKLELRKPPEFL